MQHRWIVRRRQPGKRARTVSTHESFYDANTTYDALEAGPGNTKQLLRVRTRGTPSLIRQDTAPTNQLVMEATP